MGKTLQDEARVMMLCEDVHDLRSSMSGVCYGPNAESNESRKQFVETNLASFMKKLDDYFGKYNSKFAVGNEPTIADFQLFAYIDQALVLDGATALLEKFQNIQRFLKTVRDLPEIKDYIAQSHAQLPINNKSK